MSNGQGYFTVKGNYGAVLTRRNPIAPSLSVDGQRGFAIFQLIFAPVLLALVIVMFPFTGSKYMDLIERFMVSGYQVYYFVSGLAMFLRS